MLLNMRRISPLTWGLLKQEEGRPEQPPTIYNKKKEIKNSFIQEKDNAFVRGIAETRGSTLQLSPEVMLSSSSSSSSSSARLDHNHTVNVSSSSYDNVSSSSGDALSSAGS